MEYAATIAEEKELHAALDRLVNNTLILAPQQTSNLITEISLFARSLDAESFGSTRSETSHEFSSDEDDDERHRFKLPNRVSVD